MRTILCILFVMVNLCCSSKTMNVSNQDQSIHSIYEGSLYGGGAEGFKKENFVISSENEWKSIVNKLNISNNVSDQFKTVIDFNKKNVIIAVDAVRNSTGFSIKINEVREKNDMLEVVIKSKGPAPTDMVGMAITQPIHIVTINKTNKKIVFVEN